MRKSRRAVFAFLLSAMALGVLAPAGRAADWDPIEPGQLAATKPVVDPSADVEALVWDVWVEDVLLNEAEPQTHYKHQLRLKIFNERGVESQKQVEIPFGNDRFITDVEARTVRPDGTIVELKDGDVFERTLVKAGGVKRKVKSFALPGLVPGAIVDYRWRETRPKAVAHEILLNLQIEVPAQLVRHHVKPMAMVHELGYRMAVRGFNQTVPQGEQDPRGFTVFTYRNVPAFKEEPFMPPEYMLRRWMLIYYTDTPDVVPEKFWRQYARKLYDETKARKPSGTVAAVAAEAVGGAATPADKVAKLVAACRTKVKRIDTDTSGFTTDERKRLKENKNSDDTLAHGYGSAWDVTRLFVDLAAAVGLDARVAAVPDGSFHFFDATFPHKYFLRSWDVAVKVNQGWLFCDPAASYLPAGMLSWSEEGQLALIADPEQLFIVPTPNSAPAESVGRREAKLTVSEDGTVEGDVREAFNGHVGDRLREAIDEKSAQERVDALSEDVKERLSTAELSNVVFENVQDAEKPFVRRYHVRVPNYAQRTGKRIFFQPSFFEKGGKPAFPASQRQHPILFPFAWSEEDHVTVEVPLGFTFERPQLPAPLRSEPLASYAATARLVGERTLEYERSFYFGGGGVLYFDAKNYAPLKRFFDLLLASDESILTLSQGAPAKPAGP
jgi:hypothetical protein